MSIKSEAGIYKILEDKLRASGDQPLTCVDLYDDPKVRKFARDTDAVSNFLGHMWRRGLLQRWHASRDSTARARYAYTWKVEEDSGPKPVERLHVVKKDISKPNVTITENDDCVVLDFPQFTITVQSKK